MALPLTDYSSNKQHAVPQNIMSVEFKLIGSMTVRQFVYAAAGVIGAYLTYASTLPGIFKWPLVIVIGLGGVGFAFVPVQDRGLDIWIRNFLMAISKPTLRIWKKEPLPPVFLLSDYAATLRREVAVVAPTNSRAKLMEYLGESKKDQPKNKIDIAEQLFLEHLNFSASLPKGVTPQNVTATSVILSPAKNPEHYPAKQGSPEAKDPSLGVQDDLKGAGRAIRLDNDEKKSEIIVPTKTSPILTPDIRPPTSSMLEKASINLTEQVVDLKNLVSKIRQKQGVLFELPRAVPKTKVDLPEEEVPPLLSAELKKLELETKASEEAALAVKVEEKKKQEQMTKEFEEMKASLSAVGPGLVPGRTTEKPVVDVQPPVLRPQTPIAKEVAEQPQTEKNIVLSQLPNVINGIVKDAQGKMQQGIIVVVKDEAGDPVRALKTNEIGQFVISTPLPNGKYLVTASQPGKRFATMEVVADGRVLPPLSLISKETLV